jgi:hypothetical protein
LPLNRLRAASDLAIAQQTAVLATFAELGPERLSPIFEAHNGTIPYEELHLLRLIYELEMVV